jgi:hypothetical protein
MLLMLAPRAGLAREPALLMSRTIVNLLLDITLLLAFAVLCFVSVVVRFVFPPAAAAKGWTLWGLDYDQWAGLQFAAVALLALGILVHVMLHWSWVCGVIATRVSRDKKAKVDSGTQTIYGVGLLILLINLIGLALAAAGLSISPPL